MRRVIINITDVKSALFVCLFFSAWLFMTNSVFGLGESVTSITNQHRQANGLAIYSTSNLLNSSARAKANDMCQKSYWAHTSPDGLTPWSFISATGYSYTIAGENLAKGFSTDTAIVNGWLNSSGHRANVLHAQFNETGVGSASCANGEVIVVAHYALSASRPTPAPAPAPKPAVASKTSANTTQKFNSSDRKIVNPPPIPEVIPPETFESKTTVVDIPQDFQNTHRKYNLNMKCIVETLEVIYKQNQTTAPDDSLTSSNNPNYYPFMYSIWALSWAVPA